MLYDRDDFLNVLFRTTPIYIFILFILVDFYNGYTQAFQKYDREACLWLLSSWYNSYQRNISTSCKTHEPTKWTSLFQLLGSTALFKGVKQCFSQNINDSFNHLIWSLAPKDQCLSAEESFLRLLLSVCILSHGLHHD